LMDEISKEEHRSREEFVNHFRAKYDSEPYLPLWMVTELLSLGSVSMMYKGFRHNLQKRIADRFGVPEGSFKTWLHTLSYVRNSCAHHNRLWNRQLAIAPAFPPRFPYHVPVNNRLYAVLVLAAIRTRGPEQRLSARPCLRLIRKAAAQYPGCP